MQVPTLRQMVSISTVEIAMSGLPSQLGPITPIDCRKVFTGPFKVKAYCQITAAATTLVMTGR